MGKSRLVAEFVREARRRGVSSPSASARRSAANTSYGVWREIWRRCSGVDDELAGRRAASNRLERALEEIDPALVPRAPLLDALLGISIPDNELTRSFDAELRKTSLEALLADCLRARAAEEPLVLVLEDCHWIDALSRDLLEAPRPRGGVAAGARRARVPPLSGAGRRARARALPALRRSSRSPSSSRSEAEQLIRSKLEHAARRGRGGAAGARRARRRRARRGIRSTSRSSSTTSRARASTSTDEAALARLELPESLHSLILSRIDTLTEAPRRTLKVASVVGRTFFAPALPAVYPELGSLDDVREHLGDARTARSRQARSRGATRQYIFKHVVTQEVTYESMPFAIRATLHEHGGRATSRRRSPTRSSGISTSSRTTSGTARTCRRSGSTSSRAGEAAKAKYANAAAIDYFERVAPLLEDAERWRVTRALGEVREVPETLDGAEAAYRDALALAEEDGRRLGGRLDRDVTRRARAQAGDFDEAPKWLDAARGAVRRRRRQARVRTGRCTSEASLANIRGDRRPRRAAHGGEPRDPAGSGRQAVAMGALYSNLAIVAEYEGDYERSCALHEEGLALRVEAGDTAGIAVSQMNLGVMLQRLGRMEEARARQEESLRLRREIGDPRMIALGRAQPGHPHARSGRVRRDEDAVRRRSSRSARPGRQVGARVHARGRRRARGAPRRAGARAASGGRRRGSSRGDALSCTGSRRRRSSTRSSRPRGRRSGSGPRRCGRKGGGSPLDDAIREALAFCERPRA